MNRWKLILQYDGTDFHGWQKQPDVRTVQGEVDNSLSTLFQQEITTMGQGRTDAGVHAEAQVAHVDLPDSAERGKLLHAMKGLLPRDVALSEAEIADENFHARFDAISRAYRYQVCGGRRPLYRRIVWELHQTVDVDILNRCASFIMGEHDFINFCIPNDEEEMTTISTVHKSEWSLENGILCYRVEANRFLRHMVRRLVGTMVRTSIGSHTVDQFNEMLDGSPTDKKGFSAPAQGLILEKVRY